MSGHLQVNRDIIIAKNIEESGYEIMQLKYKNGWVYQGPTIIIELLNP